EHYLPGDLRPDVVQPDGGTLRIEGHHRAVERAHRRADHQIRDHVPLGKRPQHPHLYGTQAATPAQDETDGPRQMHGWAKWDREIFSDVGRPSSPILRSWVVLRPQSARSRCDRRLPARETLRVPVRWVSRGASERITPPDRAPAIRGRRGPRAAL